MKLSRNALLLAALALVPAGAIVAPAAAQTPAATQAAEMSPEEAVAFLEGTGVFSRVIFDERDDGRYEFDAVDVDGRDVDIDIYPDGTIYDIDVDDDRRATGINLADLLPEELRTAIADNGIVDLIEFDTGSRNYTIEGFDAGGRKIEFQIGR